MRSGSESRVVPPQLRTSVCRLLSLMRYGDRDGDIASVEVLLAVRRVTDWTLEMI